MWRRFTLGTDILTQVVGRFLAVSNTNWKKITDVITSVHSSICRPDSVCNKSESDHKCV
jgi:hypothetical protein